MKPDEPTRTDPGNEHRKAPERTTAPPIEREHETMDGALKEDEERAQREKREREGR